MFNCKSRPLLYAAHPPSADEDIVSSFGNKRNSEQADLARAFTAAARFGTSMSTRHILGLKQVPRVGLSAH